jgi:Metallo-beta-lactamase superfamily
VRCLQVGWLGLTTSWWSFHTRPRPQRRPALGAEALGAGPILSYVIEHPDGLLLWDTGISPEWPTEWLKAGQQLIDLSEVIPEVCLLWLKDVGLGPDDRSILLLTGPDSTRQRAGATVDLRGMRVGAATKVRAGAPLPASRSSSRAFAAICGKGTRTVVSGTGSRLTTGMSL